MKCSVFKLTWRSIRKFRGRYMALLLIVLLSVGFFSGLKITKDTMSNTCEDFLVEHSFYDFRLLSTLGFTQEDVDRFTSLSSVNKAEGTSTLDVMMEYNGSDHPIKLFSLPKKVNLPSLSSGRWPEADNECLADDTLFDESSIGTVITVAQDNPESVTDQMDTTDFTIVGLVDSPMYLSKDRGTTGIGAGALYSYLYIPPENFTGDIYTEINITLQETADIYSDKYDKLIERHKDEITDLLLICAEDRYDSIVADSGVPPEMAEEFGIQKAETYVLTREENAGYISFENDTSIVSGIANIFPIFFVLIAMLVCITTMTRMVDEERTQIGVLKALGFDNGQITAKYLLYAGSATVIGWAIGFFVCTWGLPEIFWFAYKALYDFSPLHHFFSIKLAVLTLTVSLIGILGSTLLSCRKELNSVPATLIRPRAAKNGRRILLERITPLWKRFSFLHKITLRNMFRYKRRLVMMLIGISCCTGLVVTGFGVRDSMINTSSLQFDHVQLYDMETTFETGTGEAVAQHLNDMDCIENYEFCHVRRVDLLGKAAMNSVSLMSFQEPDSLPSYWNFHHGEEPVSFPAKGEAIVNEKVAAKLNLCVGDSVEIRDADMETATVTVSGIFDNYINNFIILSSETYEALFEPWVSNTALLSVRADQEDTAKALTNVPEIKSVTPLSATKEAVDNALSCLDYIIGLIVLFSGMLAFIVIYNLTNINLAERSREIATVQVLGFYPKETESYVLRENLLLSVLASLIGLPLGTLFHRIVMNMIVVDSFFYHVHITPLSYILALLCTIFFAIVVNLFMKKQINQIHMTESLKAVE